MALLAVAAASLAFSVPLLAQIEIGKLIGTVNDPSGASVSKAQVSIENPLSGRRTQGATDDHGEFRFENIPYGTYILRVSASGFSSIARTVDIRSNVPVRITLALTIAPAGTEVTVEASIDLATETPRTETVIDESYIKLAPTVVRRDQLQALISTAPGWNTENDGLMHIRGVDDGTLYVVGGVPTPDRIDGLFAGSFNTDAITSLDVITGNIPAEFGDRSGAVVLVQPKSGIGNPLNGTLSLGAGSFDSRDLSTTLGGGTRNWGFFFAGSGHQSDRFLDPVDPRNFNNIGGDVSLELRSDWNATDKDAVHLSGMISSEFDTPITAKQNRHHTRQGLLASVTHVTHGHNLKMDS